jgi:hypothetical protein
VMSPDTVDASAAFAVDVLAVDVVGFTELVVVEAVVAEVVSCSLSSLGGSVTFTTRLSGRKVFSSSLRAALIFSALVRSFQFPNLDDSQKRKDDEVHNGTRLNQESQRYSAIQV